ncbi:hypothetical protein FNT36_14595 [Hymenobacter setariae]|uniref:Uncharacterized protein n=1 Tax=Hymenobacter setariae TaxID=2594794 RepID=A0A558BVY5_9BACT|nr:hypothetical protein [Hymenobacter setariae]TVT40690.1 hypothetical protein FNT36_14595 [Hymenobacter setariae]
MKKLSLTLGRVTLVVATALSLGACGRADYAPLSRATTQPASTPIAQATPYVPVADDASATVKVATPTQAAPTAPVAVQPAPATPAATPAIVAPATPAVAPAASVAAVAPQASAATAPAPKMNLVQRLTLRKITKKLDKLASQAPQLKQRDASAARGGLDGNLRSAVLFGLIGLIVLLFSGVNAIFGIVGTILLVIGLVFLVLWLLDQA